MMLQKIDKLEWRYEDEDGAVLGLYENGRIALEDVTEIGGLGLGLDLPPGVVLAQEVDALDSAPADPFMPSPEEWAQHPDAKWATVDTDGQRVFWHKDNEVSPWPDEKAFMWTNAEGSEFACGDVIPMPTLDAWLNSLRHRPQ